MNGLSPRNLRYMRGFAQAYPEFPILQVPLAKIEDIGYRQLILPQLTWYHHITLLDKVKNSDLRLFYIQQTIENGWSRNVMVHQIESGLHKRRGQLLTNFSNTIAHHQSELVQQIFKSPYIFDFINLGKEIKERELEDALISQITEFLLELGQWFAFMGRQYKVMFGDNECYFDLLFYHTRLKRYIIIDLKIDDFKPEYTGKMTFYLNIADQYLKQADDEKSIGLILCKTKDGLIAEYALQNTNNPIGITEYKLNEKLPQNMESDLPSIEDIEREMQQKLSKLEKPIEKKITHLKELLLELGQEEIKDKLNGQHVENILNHVVFTTEKSQYKNLFQKFFLCLKMLKFQYGQITQIITQKKRSRNT